MYLNMNVEETRTHRNQTSGNWHIFMGKARQQWGMLTNDNEDLSKGYEREMAGRFQKFYGISKEEADLEIKNWVN
ncbi:MAG: CsbD family protein [Nitrococcus mobilis]|nr:CsbD family protein [Nitrococcus mobilis]